MARHESLFSYNITRPYPFRWFTPVVIAGGIVITVLVSFLNVAASGYELIATSSTNPNTTLSDGNWYANWPSWLASTRASCETTTMPLQTGLYTNNTALPYTLVSAWRYDKSRNQISLGSLIYDNNPLLDCNVTSIQIGIESNDRTAGQVAVSQVGATLTANAVCLIERPEGQTYLELATTYDAIPPPSVSSSIFLDTNATNKASLYWGHSVMRLYWADLIRKYYLENVDQGRPFYKAAVTLNRLDDAASKPTTKDDLTDMDFLRVPACWLMPLNSTGISHTNKFCDSNTISELAQGSTNQKPMPSTWGTVSVLGKAMWFTVLADLGRDDDSLPNMLAHPDLLESLTANMTNVNETLGTMWSWGLQSSSRSLVPYAASKDGDSQLGITRSVLATNYVCQLPRLKSTGALIVSVLVADLVLLQAVWKIYVLGVDYFFTSKKEELKYCEGCARNLMDQRDIPLENVKSPGVGGVGYDEYLSVERGGAALLSPSSRHSLLDHGQVVER
ncbi:hypothetical protein J7T55_005518 [Diaporthe amygdali]|uniref:uncharacterized protein n=1 Tax=Phomopsis amygdali TaxID=1214568 RepID=UPI0022FE68FD|nr:uncharacterized protein J7T55_005518 [Diaporthe amygdali]KAJ0108970.1 hypothetical protein J7T55_005518 [Diaporthe amygdali]